jgi:hypothetical protein
MIGIRMKNDNNFNSDDIRIFIHKNVYINDDDIPVTGRIKIE